MTDPSSEAPKPLELRRELGLLAAVAAGVGSIIGSGIFKKPALMASQLGSPELLILVWVVAGVMTLFGALSIAETAGLFQDPGGQYAYFNKGYGRFVGYLYGWAVFIVTQTGSLAAIAYVFSDSLGYFVKFPRLSAAWESFSIPVPGIGAMTPFKSIGLKLTTIGLVLFLTAMNYLGVRFGNAIAVVFSALKVGVLAAIVVLAFTLGHGSVENFTASVPAAAGSPSVFLMFIMAMAGAFWSYDAWINMTFLSGEIKNVQRNLPRAMAMTVLIVIAVYVLINLAYIYVIPVPKMAAKYSESYLVAVDVAESFLGRWGAAAIALAIMISTFGAVNSIAMTSARVYFAMAREKLFFRKLGRVHPRFRTPATALAVQGIWASLLVFSGTFDQLTDMLIFVSWVFYALAALSVFTLRRRMPDAPRPYKVWGYPATPILFILFASVYIVFTLYTDIMNFRSGQAPIINSLMGLIWVALGVPGYIYWRRKSRREERAASQTDFSREIPR
ncbi:MAG: amino acid permease [Candidatus Aminicenantes bacterium]|nr:amino acid permease [Candidatus Aminicenantes bacterium]